MQRIPEPELMDDPQQALAYARADFEEPHGELIRLLAAAHPDLPATGRALDLGCGPGDITRRFAQAWPGYTVVGVDGAPAMLTIGREDMARHGVAERVTLLEARLPAPPPAGPWDLVFSNSLLHHLADPMALWETVRACGPGAAVFVMDLRRPPDPDTAAALVETYAAGEPEVLRRDFHHSLFAAYEPDEVRAQLTAAGLDGLEVAVVSDRHLVVSGRVGFS